MDGHGKPGGIGRGLPRFRGFATYAHKTIGPAAGFVTAWLYWLCWVAALASEFTASALIMGRWFPGVDTWVWCLLFAAALFGLNAYSVRWFGEAESWFSTVKVATIVVFIVLGAALILGWRAPDSGAPLLGNFLTPEGLFPTGLSGVALTTLAVFYAFSGTELIAITAGETAEPQRTIPRALRATLLRLLLFFVGAIFVVAALLPYSPNGEAAEETVENSPFVMVFEQAGIPYAADLMAIVVIIALLSAGNSGLYACSRLLYSLAHKGQLPAAFGRTTAKGVPLLAVAVSLAGGLFSLFNSVLSPGGVYLALVSIAGFAVVAVWIIIVVAHLSYRRAYLAAGGSLADLPYRAPGYPWVPYLTLAACLVSLVAVAFDPNQVAALLFGVPFVVLCLAIYYLVVAPAGRSPQGLPGNSRREGPRGRR
ncbi:Amino-acid permease RocE [Corynebacterium lowii]|uniref:Amino-acid permease RocE n=1 Tax=Corynebacterium lowii TaxID=1544413 RepID=A0A0Q0UMD6_9CORY|nr:amino acid permease [Corynebacterium lowii]KQB87574.1 Amino-acid permease RocE [Corynebacterium lowii]MDP9851831.1 S-methylmethionine transporter [Corynebacterium lowii]